MIMMADQIGTTIKTFAAEEPAWPTTIAVAARPTPSAPKITSAVYSGRLAAGFSGFLVLSLGSAWRAPSARPMRASMRLSISAPMRCTSPSATAAS
jgi:hypothetical protein